MINRIDEKQIRQILNKHSDIAQKRFEKEFGTEIDCLYGYCIYSIEYDSDDRLNGFSVNPIFVNVTLLDKDLEKLGVKFSVNEEDFAIIPQKGVITFSSNSKKRSLHYKIK